MRPSGFELKRIYMHAIINKFGDEGEDIIHDAITEAHDGLELSEIDINNGDYRDILGITLNMCDYIENRWFLEHQKARLSQIFDGSF